MHLLKRCMNSVWPNDERLIDNDTTSCVLFFFFYFFATLVPKCNLKTGKPRCDPSDESSNSSAATGTIRVGGRGDWTSEPPVCASTTVSTANKADRYIYDSTQWMCCYCVSAVPPIVISLTFCDSACNWSDASLRRKWKPTISIVEVGQRPVSRSFIRRNGQWKESQVIANRSQISYSLPLPCYSPPLRHLEKSVKIRLHEIAY